MGVNSLHCAELGAADVRDVLCRGMDETLQFILKKIELLVEIRKRERVPLWLTRGRELHVAAGSESCPLAAIPANQAFGFD